MSIDNDAITNIPAVAGGKPIKTEPYGTGEKYGNDELELLRNALDQGTLFYAQGSLVKTMEEKICALIGSKYAIATSSGTASIHAAMIAAGISPGDEVIVTPITDMGSLAPILWQGGIPVFADVDPNSYCITPETVEAVCSEKTRAVLAVHLWGNACDIDGLKAVCEKRNLILIEDCAQAWGCEYKNRLVGSYGHFGCFSLNEFKHITCGDGGVVVTDNEEFAIRLRLATDKCYSRDMGAAVRTPRFLANNYRLTELQGAVAIAQIDKLQSIILRRRDSANRLNKGISTIQGILPPKTTQGCDPSWWFYMFRVEPEILGVDADEFANALKAEGISAGAHYIGQCIYEYPIFVNHSAFERGEHPYSKIEYGNGICKVAESVLQTAIMLPINENHNVRDVDDTILAMRRLAEWFCSRK